MGKDFITILDFFQNKQDWTPGDYDYNAAFCRCLAEAASAREASIWRLDRDGWLHMVYGTNLDPEELSDVILREGEGITGAAVLSRQIIAVTDALAHPQHDHRMDTLLGYPTRAMISAPIVFRDFVYGVVNILNPESGTNFPSKWKEHLSAAATLYAVALAAENRLVYYERPEEEQGLREKITVEALRNKTVVVGVSPAIQEALHLCLKTGNTDMPVLIRGETGSGKELAARRIHEASRRANGPFVDVNCAALTETLLESELFGHVKGSFSGANRDRKGKFSTAAGGTLFLDEIGDMSLACQAKILRVLQEKKFMPVGSDKTKESDARVIAATNYDLWSQVKRNKFREDLYYRLCGIEILMPPLRERPEDIYPLTMHFLHKIAAEQKQTDSSFQIPKISQEAIKMIMSFHWPGNVRQLEQATRAAVAICEGDEILPEDFPSWLQDAMRTDVDSPEDENAEINSRLELPKSYKTGKLIHDGRMEYVKALEETKYPGTGRWNLTAAARHLNIPRKTFTYRLKKMRMIG